jgi:hypothetical protein
VKIKIYTTALIYKNSALCIKLSDAKSTTQNYIAKNWGGGVSKLITGELT